MTVLGKRHGLYIWCMDWFLNKWTLHSTSGAKSINYVDIIIVFFRYILE